MKFIFVVFAAILITCDAYNATFYPSADAIEGQYIIVVKVEHDVHAFAKLLTTHAFFADAEILATYTKALHGFSAKLSTTALEKVRSMSEVEYIAEDAVVEAFGAASWGLDRVDQRSLPLNGHARLSATGGQGANVYIIDTGILPQSLYFDGAVAFDAFGDSNTTLYGFDCNGHGTHCAGTAAGTPFGVAPGAKINGVRVLDCDGFGAVSGIVAAIDFVIQEATRPAVASMSLGGNVSFPLDEAVRNMIAAGITTVVAAGNSDEDACNISPARVPGAITVGAVDIDDHRAYFSNYGSCVDIFAPGVNIPSSWIGSPEVVNTISGTSMACPHVAGAVALILQRALDAGVAITPAEVKTKILNDSTKGVVIDASATPNRLLYVRAQSTHAEFPENRNNKIE